MVIAFKAAVHDPKIASFRYRVEVPVAALRARGHAVEIFDPARAERYDMLVFSKSYRRPDQDLARAVKARGGGVALDLCDNHFYNPYDLPRYRQAREDLLAMIALADRVIVSTPALGAVVRLEAGLKSEPLVVGDIAEHVVPTGTRGRGAGTLLWFGSHGSPNAPSGITDLLGIAPHLREAHGRTPFELVVASNDREKFDKLAPQLGVPSRYVEWTHARFGQLLGEADAVLLPLSDNPFVACKTHNRITTALWAGVPVVADPLESYREFAPFAWIGDWAAGLRTVLEAPDEARARAAPARRYIDRHWSIEALVPRWEESLGLSSNARPDGVVPGARSKDPPAEPRRKASLYQGALDPIERDRVTGWARVISQPTMPVAITLEADGKVVSSGMADRPRADLADVGFRHSGCGFVLRVPAGWLDGQSRSYAVVADGWHVIESGKARFGMGEAPSARPPEVAPPSAAPASAATIRSPDRRGAAQRGTSDAERARADIRLQKTLADELEALDEALDVVRRVAARIILAAGGARVAPTPSPDKEQPSAAHGPVIGGSGKG